MRKQVGMESKKAKGVRLPGGQWVVARAAYLYTYPDVVRKYREGGTGRGCTAIARRRINQRATWDEVGPATEANHHTTARGPGASAVCVCVCASAYSMYIRRPTAALVGMPAAAGHWLRTCDRLRAPKMQVGKRPRLRAAAERCSTAPASGRGGCVL